MASREKLSADLHAHDQRHLVGALDSLQSEEERQILLQDLQSINLDEMCGNFERSMGSGPMGGNSMTNGHTEKPKSIDDRMEPIADDLCASVIKSSSKDLEIYCQSSMQHISQGHVGVLLLAGGQGTRLGVPYPKGMYDIGLPSGKTLYQIQVERILRLEKMAQSFTGAEDVGNGIYMYVMTSEHTKKPTEEFFAKHNYFGSRKDKIIFFEQRMIPCFDFEGKIILETPTKIARAPDGNGGLYWALKNEGILEHMEQKNVQYLHVYCVDNVLVKVADPVFMGYCIEKGAEAGNKVVEKFAPNEAVGVVCRVDGKFQVVEYSEIGTANAELTRSSGQLVYYAGNICNHFFTTAFLRKVSEKFDHLLPHHVAKKKIPCIEQPKPTANNGIKLEKFVFDVFQFSESFVVWECKREEEFSPLKNADKVGVSDTPTTAREALLKLHKKYVEDAGGEVSGQVEISPLLSYAGENLRPNLVCDQPTVILE